jgi:glycosyltransferase involved in cell wall biosynthesis
LQYAPFVSGAFSEEVKEEREAYVLCHGFNRRDIPMILSAWTWVDGSLGDSFPLTFLGAEPDLAREIDATAAELDIEDSVRVQPEIAFEDLPRMYGSAAAFIGTAFKAAGQTLRWALAAGAPVVGPKTDSFKSVLGSAAYLVPPDDSRSLGAACLTVLIQERVSEPLRSEGFIRAGNYLDGRAGAEIVSILRDVAKVGRRTTEHGK